MIEVLNRSLGFKIIKNIHKHNIIRIMKHLYKSVHMTNINNLFLYFLCIKIS